MNTWHKGFAAMSILAAVAVGGTIGPGTAWADHGGDRGGRCSSEERGGGWKGHGHRGQRLAKALGLSKEQKEQVETIFRKHRGETAKLREEMVSERRELRKLILSDTPDEVALREQAKKIAATSGDLAVRRARMFQEVRAVLTPEQIGKFRTLREKRDQGTDHGSTGG